MYAGFASHNPELAVLATRVSLACSTYVAQTMKEKEKGERRRKSVRQEVISAVPRSITLQTLLRSWSAIAVGDHVTLRWRVWMRGGSSYREVCRVDWLYFALYTCTNLLQHRQRHDDPWVHVRRFGQRCCCHRANQYNVQHHGTSPGQLGP